jgi:hypothetical protein
MACAVAAAAASARAAEVPLYRVTVPLKGATEEDRNAAFAEALRAVVMRASGRRDVGANPVISKSAGRANRLVQQYSATSGGDLTVGFEPVTIDEVLTEAGLPSWPSERPATLVVMPGGPGGRALRSGEASAASADLETAARARGVPLVWPVADVGVDTVRSQLESSGVAGAARAAGSQADAVLIGTSAGGQTDWLLVHAADSARRRGSAADGAHLAADTFAATYAPDSTRSLSTVSVRVDGVGSLQAYAGLMKELEALSMVRGVAVDEIQGSTVRLDLILRGDLELLRRIAALTPTLKPTEASDPAAPQFIYVP